MEKTFLYKNINPCFEHISKDAELYNIVEYLLLMLLKNLFDIESNSIEKWN